MKDYEYRRTTFYTLRGHESFEDDHSNFPIIQSPETTVEDAVVYLTDGSSYLRFPGAARAVAVATADFIARNFNEDFYEVLNDPNLMHRNDPYFRTYEEDKTVYDEILKRCPRETINWESERMGITGRLIREEYLLDDEGLKVLPFPGRNSSMDKS
ncbi:MAG: hypothetical protein ACLGHN_13835 [Bacteriovoracia bacterium]